MQIKKLCSVYIILTFLFASSILAISSSAKDDSSPVSWNSNWEFRQELHLPISTDNIFAKLQPIDIKMRFDHSCWAKDEYEHSIRVVCWDGRIWHELESQIYDLEYSGSEHIKSCDLVFLVPEIADGKERYFIYYDDDKKPSPDYIDHVDVEDVYYYYEPISGISAEGDYYKITEDGYCVYGVGQKGQVVDRKLSQCVISEKPESKNFDALNAYHIASFCFSYQNGPKDEDEISSDQSLVSKEILTDGNLMIEFGIVSESSGKELRSSNVYKYYYCPNDKKRIFVHVKHEVLEEVVVSGMINIDGRYGTLFSYKSKSERLHRMRFGEILPYLHVYSENDDVLEYQIGLNPESYEREWIVPYHDDCDIGKNAWFSYDEGKNGKSHAVIFSSNSNIVKSGTDERDGIQLKVAEREYLDVIGAEIDYASINFGRNSYERGGDHDLIIPDDLVVEYDAEVYTSDNGGYTDVDDEAEIYRTLVKYRQDGRDGLFGEDKKIYTLTVTPRFTARVLSHPFLRNTTGITISEIWAELYQSDELISVAYTNKPLFAPPNIRFPKIAAGEYVVKVYRRILNFNKSYIGIEAVTVNGDTDLDVYCTWQKNIDVKCLDQHGKGIHSIKFVLLKNITTVACNITDTTGILTLYAPFNLFDSYVLNALYKGFTIYNEEIPMSQKNVDIELDLYDLTVSIKDKLGLVPGVNVRPFLTSSEMYKPIHIEPEAINSGTYIFRDLPAGPYEFQISYGAFKDTRNLKIPDAGDSINIEFSALYDINLELVDILGLPIQDTSKTIQITRKGLTIRDTIGCDETVTLPPGEYTINVYSDGKHVGIKNIKLTSNRNIKIVTTIKSTIPILITGLVLVFIGEIFVLVIFKKISLNTFLKLLAMSLILISLFQPWWVLNASNENLIIEKNTEMFIMPRTMIETLNYENVKYLDLATMPEMFTDSLGVLMLVICSGFVLLGISFVPNIILKRRFYNVLIFASVLFLILVVVAFSYGMSRICEISVGSLQGEGTLDVVLPDGGTALMHANWGLGLGFYLCIFAAMAALVAGITDYLRKRNWPKTLRKKILRF